MGSEGHGMLWSSPQMAWAWSVEWVTEVSAMRIGYADPPYIGCAHLYSDQPDFAGEVDHKRLVDRLQSEFDGWVLHAAATARSIAKRPRRLRLGAGDY